MNTLRFLSALGGPLLLSAPLAAQEADASAVASAVALYDSAQALLARGDARAACPKFAESYRLDPQVGVLLSLADCHERAGQLASAYASFREGAELAALRRDDREPLAKERANALESRLSRVTVATVRQVPGLRVQFSKVKLQAESFGVAIPVDAGTYEVRASAPGFETFRSRLDVTGEGTSNRLDIPDLVPLAPAAENPPAVRPAADTELKGPAFDDKPASRPARTLGFVLAGLGVAGTALGVVFTVQSRNRLGERDGICPSSVDCEPGSNRAIAALTDQARSLRNAATVSFVSGGALLAGGAALVLFTSRDGAKPRQHGFRLVPVVAEGGLEIVASAHF